MSTDFESFSARELSALIAEASRRLRKLKKRKPATTVRKQIPAVARQAGYTLAEPFGGSSGRGGRPGDGKRLKATKNAPRKSRKTGSAVAPKYRNPGKPAETWSARGMQPR